MAAMDVDAFYRALDLCYVKVDSAIDSRCNMNEKVRDEARNAMSELKSLIKKNFEFIKSFNDREACKANIADLGKQITWGSMNFLVMCRHLSEMWTARALQILVW